MWWIGFHGCKKWALTSSSCCATNWSSTNSTFTNAETICRKSETGLGRTNDSLMTMKVLVLNSGSSSQKSCLYEIGDALPEDPPVCVWEGKIEWYDHQTQFSIKNSHGVSRKDQTSVGSRGEAVERLLNSLWS